MSRKIFQTQKYGVVEVVIIIIIILPRTTTLQWWGGLCTSMNPRDMLVGANAPGRVTQARQVEG